MGLTSWKGKKVRQADVTIAKNYLAEDELRSLNRIVTMYLDYAEDQAERHQPMYMRDWAQKLDAFFCSSTDAMCCAMPAGCRRRWRRYWCFRNMKSTTPPAWNGKTTSRMSILNEQSRHLKIETRRKGGID